MSTKFQTRQHFTEDTLWLVVAIWAVLVAFFALLGIGSLLLKSPTQSSPPRAIGVTTQQSIDATQEPVQNYLPTPKLITIEQSPSTWTLIPRASYRIAARVISARTYSADWWDPVSPMDLALGWGDLSYNSFDSQIQWRQNSRWLFYNWSGELPISTGYIYSHVANVHIIPATDNLRIALTHLKTDDLILLEGLLVDAEKKQGNEPDFQTAVTSLTRTDQGNNSCEIFYVERLVVTGLEYR